MIDVEQEHGEGKTVLLGPVDHASEPLHEVALVEQLRQSVVVRGGFDLLELLRVVERRRTEVGRHLQHLLLLLGELQLRPPDADHSVGPLPVHHGCQQVEPHADRIAVEDRFSDPRLVAEIVAVHRHLVFCDPADAAFAVPDRQLPGVVVRQPLGLLEPELSSILRHVEDQDLPGLEHLVHDAQDELG